METATGVKRPRGRPRTDAPSRPAVHVRLPPALKAELEENARRASRSVTKEIEVRLAKGYLRDEMYGGPQMAAMFREMAKVAFGVARQKNRGSFFEDFETFVYVREIWQLIIQRRMPRPNEDLLAEVCREWDAFKSGSLQTPAQQAAREWLIHHTPMTLAQALVGAFEPAISRSVGPREPAHDEPATPEATEPKETVMPPKPLLSVGAAPSIGSLAKALEGVIPSEVAATTAFSGSAIWPIGSLAKIMEGLIPSQGSARSAAFREVSRLAQLLAEMTVGEAASDAAVPPAEPDPGGRGSARK
jgi:hypothetical protein